MDKSSESLLRELYARFNTEPEYSISAPEYQKEQIDALVNDKLIERIDASSLTGWEYIIRPTYAGKVYFQNKNKRSQNTADILLLNKANSLFCANLYCSSDSSYHKMKKDHIQGLYSKDVVFLLAPLEDATKTS